MSARDARVAAVPKKPRWLLLEREENRRPASGSGCALLRHNLKG